MVGKVGFAGPGRRRPGGGGVGGAAAPPGYFLQLMVPDGVRRTGRMPLNVIVATNEYVLGMSKNKHMMT